MSRGPHPTLTSALSGLRRATAFTEAAAGAEDLESRLATLHHAAAPSLIGALSDLLGGLARQAAALPDLTDADRDLIAGHLETAAERLGLVGESIDRARAATGEWTR